MTDLKPRLADLNDGDLVRIYPPIFGLKESVIATVSRVMPKKLRVHREWFMPLRKRTCECGAKHTDVFALGEYRVAKWRTVQHFCRACWPIILKRLVAHAADCGCTFEVCARSGHSLPDWIAIPSVCKQ